MEIPEQSAWEPRPEFDNHRPAALFDYARRKQQWAKRNMNNFQLPEALLYLADELNHHVDDVFKEGKPEVIVTATDVYCTREITNQGPFHTIEVGPLPPDDDSVLLGEYTLRGELHSFYVDESKDSELYAYISCPEEPRKYPGGMYLPFYSVSVEDAKIELAEESTAAVLNAALERISEQLAEYSDTVKGLTLEVTRILKQNRELSAKKLHEISPLLTEIAGYNETSQQFMNHLLEIVKLELQFDLPHTIHTSAYRRSIGRYGYAPQRGPAIFDGVTAYPELIGETGQKHLALSFALENDNVQIPVQYITVIYGTKQG